jgi:hypothetical protein
MALGRLGTMPKQRIPIWQQAPAPLLDAPVPPPPLAIDPAPKPARLVAWSWSDAGWYIAVLLGIWGALMGTGDYDLANKFFVFSALVFLVKLGHVAQLHKESRKTLPFLLGLFCTAGLVIMTWRWTTHKASDAEAQKAQLARLDKLPELQKEVDRIPKLEDQITHLTTDVTEKQTTIEGLTHVVINQNREIAASAHKELAQTKIDLSGQILKTEANLNTNINQYRTDETTAVSRVLRPARTLGVHKDDLIKALKNVTPGIHEVAISSARGNRECLDFANEIEEAFKSAGWTIKRTRFALITKDGVGLQVLIKSINDPLTPDQIVVAVAFKAIGMEMIGGEMNVTDGPVEVYIGLQ